MLAGFFSWLTLTRIDNDNWDHFSPERQIPMPAFLNSSETWSHCFGCSLLEGTAKTQAVAGSCLIVLRWARWHCRPESRLRASKVECDGEPAKNFTKTSEGKHSPRVANFENIKSAEKWSVSCWTFQVVTVAFNHGIDFDEKVYPEKQQTENQQL